MISVSINFNFLLESESGKAINERWQELACNDSKFQFMRRGVVGSHKDELSQEQCDRISAWSDGFLKDSDYGKNYGKE